MKSHRNVIVQALLISYMLGVFVTFVSMHLCTFYECHID